MILSRAGSLRLSIQMEYGFRIKFAKNNQLKSNLLMAGLRKNYLTQLIKNKKYC